MNSRALQKVNVLSFQDVGAIKVTEQHFKIQSNRSGNRSGRTTATKFWWAQNPSWSPTWDWLRKKENQKLIRFGENQGEDDDLERTLFFRAWINSIEKFFVASCPQLFCSAFTILCNEKPLPTTFRSDSRFRVVVSFNLKLYKSGFSF